MKPHSSKGRAVRRLPPHLAVALVLLTAAATAAGPIEAVTTPGSGTLTMCRDWLVHEACDTYHRIAVPAQVAVGDKIEITYGSNPKDYTFHVTGFHQHGDGCTILSSHSTPDESGEKIEVADCRAMPKPASGER